MRVLIGLAAAGLLVGCSVFPDKTLNYREAKTIKEMEVPAGMHFAGKRDVYVVQNEDDRLQEKVARKDRFSVPEPPQLIAVNDDGEVAASAEPSSVAAVLSRDGNGYPILMLDTDFTWAWEYVTRALKQTDFNVEDVNRSVGIIYVALPKRMGVKDNRAQLKLSNTVNGVQVAVLNQKGSALLAQDSSQELLEALRREL